MRPERSEARDCLVAVVNNDRDLHCFTDERWYRIPVRAIGRSLTEQALREARWLALYQTAGVRDGLGGAIELWGEIEERALMRRRDLLPSEPDHAGADDLYHVLRVGGVHRLAAPIISRRPRRVVFLRTSRRHLLHASDINELVVGSDEAESLWQSLRERFDAGEMERCYYLRVGDVAMEVDFAIFVDHGGVAVVCDEEPGNEGEGPAHFAGEPVHRFGGAGESEPSSSQSFAAPSAWLIVRFSPARLRSGLDGCVREIVACVNDAAGRAAPTGAA